MAVASYSTDLTSIDDAEVVGNYSALGGGASGLSDETDYFIEGTQCVSKSGFTASTKGFITNTGTHTVASGDAIFVWGKQNNRNLMDTVANGGMQFIVGDSTSAYDHFEVDGSDSEGSALAGWRTYAIDPTQTPSSTTGSPTTTNRVGFLWKILGSGSLKGNPNGMDASWHGREIRTINGQAAAYGTFDGAATADASSAWGILTPVAGGYQFHGAFVMGTTGTSVDFRDSDRVINILDDPFLPAGFNEFEIRNASSNVEWTNIIISHLGTTSPAVLTLDVGTFAGDTCQFNGFSTTTFSSTGSCVNTTWTNCGAVTAAGANLSGSSILTPNVTANTSGLIWDVNADPNNDLNGMTFTKTSGVAHHAIEFGTNIPTTTITLTGCNFGTDFSATEDGSVGDETFHFKDTTGTITLNLVDCTGNFGYRTEGVVVTISSDPVTTTVHVEEVDGTNIQNARVLLRAADGTGDLMYLQDVSTLTSSGTTATCTMAAPHGLTTGDYVVISNVDPVEYGKQTSVTVTSTTAFTYTVDSGLTTPASGSGINVFVDGQDETSYNNSPTTEGTYSFGTNYSTGDTIVVSNGATITVDQDLSGAVAQFTVDNSTQTTAAVKDVTYTQSSTSGSGTGFDITPDTDNIVVQNIKVTGAIISGLTDVNGDIDDTRVLSVDQPVVGYARKSTTATQLFKTAPISGTVSSSTGATFNLIAISDE